MDKYAGSAGRGVARSGGSYMSPSEDGRAVGPSSSVLFLFFYIE